MMSNNDSEILMLFSFQIPATGLNARRTRPVLYARVGPSAFVHHGAVLVRIFRRVLYAVQMAEATSMFVG